MKYSDVVSNWQAYASVVDSIGGDVQAMTIDEPASVEEVEELQDNLNMVLPASIKEVLLNFSRKVEFRWFFPNNFELESELSSIFSGERHWSPKWMVAFNESKDGWIESCFPNKHDAYDRVWHDKFAFHEVGNGDYLAIDVKKEFEPVVYLSHDDGEGHGVVLAPNFKEFILTTSRLGCVGGEDWQMMPFIESEKPYINPDCENAKKFRSDLGINA